MARRHTFCVAGCVLRCLGKRQLQVQLVGAGPLCDALYKKLVTSLPAHETGVGQQAWPQASGEFTLPLRKTANDGCYE